MASNMFMVFTTWKVIVFSVEAPSQYHISVVLKTIFLEVILGFSIFCFCLFSDDDNDNDDDDYSLITHTKQLPNTADVLLNTFFNKCWRL